MGLRDELVDVTCDLMRIESIDTRPDQLLAVIDYAEAYVRRSPDLHIERFLVEDKPSLFVSLRGTRSPAIVYNAHLDVVPGRPDQFDPVIKADRIYGRGSQDMKGSAAVMLRLVHELAALPERPDVGFQFVSDEEIGGMHGTGMFASQGYGAGFFLAGEPTDHQICHLQKGAAWIEVHFKGQPAHGSRPWDGLNAMASLRDGLVALEQRFPSPDEAAWVTTVTPTVIQGGTAGNRLPEQVRLTLDVRYVPEEHPEQVLAGLRECFRQGEVHLIRSGPPLDTPADHQEITRLRQIVREVTETPALLYREHYASDARFYSTIGIPAVCYGPVGAGLHSDEEWVSITSLVEMYKVLQRFALAA